MKLWFTEIGEPLPFETDMRLHRYGMLTQALAAMGHDVTWWTSTFSHAAKRHVFGGDRDETFNGVRIRLLHGPGYRKNVSFARIRHQKHFAARFIAAAEREPSPHLLVAPIPTLEAAEMAMRFAKARGVPIVTDIRDEWPEEFVDLAPKPLRWMARLALTGAFRRLEYVCRSADGIIGMSRRQLDYGLRYSGRQEGPNDGVFPHGYSTQPVDPVKVREARGWWSGQGVREGAFVACFFGTIGRFFALDAVIEAARALERRNLDFQFVLCGEGSNLGKYRRQAAGLRSVIFPGWVGAPQIAALMELSAVGLAPYDSGTRMSLPNKPFEYFAGGLPVVSSIEGELTGVLAEHDCGVTYQARSPEALVSALTALYADRSRARDMGRNGRRLLDREYATEIIFEKLNGHLTRVAARGRDPSP